MTQPNGSMSGAAQVGLQAFGLVHRRGLGERDHEHPRELAGRAGARAVLRPRRARSRWCAAPRAGSSVRRRAAAACGRSARCRARRSAPGASSTVRANARNTAISSVHGERRSSSSSDRPSSVERGRRRGPRPCSAWSRRRGRCARRRGLGLGVGERVADMRGGVGRGQRDFVAAVDEREAMAAASVVLPTPPLPIVMTHAGARRVELVYELSESRQVDGCRTAGSATGRC